MSTIAATSAQGPVTRILVAVDGSEYGLRAAKVAADFARALAAHLTVLTVYAEPSAALGEPNYSEALHEGRRALDSARQAVIAGGGPEPETECLGGAPAETILSVARDGAYDLVVVGSRGRGRLQAALLGSVSSAVAARAGRPVLVVGEPS
jgi:nucleotide-binding universal stress UspA family protein